MRRTIALSLLLALAAGAVGALRPLKAVDLHVYHAAARSFFLLFGSMYGPNQELGSAPVLADAGDYPGAAGLALGLPMWQ